MACCSGCGSMSPACLRTVVSRAITVRHPATNAVRYPAMFDCFEQRVDDERVATAVADDARIEQARRRRIGPLALPPELGVALVADDDGAQFAAPARAPRATRRW